MIHGWIDLEGAVALSRELYGPNPMHWGFMSIAIAESWAGDPDPIRGRRKLKRVLRLLDNMEWIMDGVAGEA